MSEVEESRVEEIEDVPAATPAAEQPADVPAEMQGGAEADAEEKKQADRASEDAEEGHNPLVMEDAKPVKSSKKKKKTAGAAAEDKELSAVDLISRKLEELGKKNQASPAAQGETGATSTEVSARDVGVDLLRKGGEKALREAFQQCIQAAKKLERELTLLKRKSDTATKEKDRLNLDTTEAKAAHQRMQLKCLTLQKEVKALKEAADKIEADKETQRTELENKFQTAIDDITSKLKDGATERESLRTENEELEAKVQQIEADCEGRFEKYKEVHDEKATELETKRKAEEIVEIKSVEERMKAKAVEEELKLTLRSVADLKMQIKLYSERMVEFEDSVTKSRDVFGTFGKEIARMKDHAEALAKARDDAKAELVALEKATQGFSSERQALRRQIDAQTKENTKVKESAQKMTAKRANWKPYDALVQAWKQSVAEDADDAEKAASLAHTDPNAENPVAA